MGKKNAAGNRIDIRVKEALYPLDAIMTAAYGFIDRAYILLDYGKNGDVVVRFRSKKKTSPEVFAALRGEFENELLHQSLRVALGKKNRKTRELIITQALYALKPGEDELEKDEDIEEELKGILAEADEEGADYLEDPLGIAVPWEEKHKKKDE
ncbi:MAG: His-Xaa-Ser system protein HxsD [bacterium]